MFSPDVTNAASARSNPRRRVRATTSDESLTASNARPSTKRRKRSALAPDTFEPNGIAGDPRAHGTAAINGHAKLPNGKGSFHKEQSPDDARNQPEAEPSASHSLAETDHYTIWKDSDLPAALQNVLGKGETFEKSDGGYEHTSDIQPESWRADLAPSKGYAVALTHTQAVVWPYARDASFQDGSNSLNIKLPFQTTPARYSREPLPLSALVHDATIGELALLVIIPTTGKLVYWESILTASKADTIRQHKQGLHGAITGLYSSEQVQEIIEAEPDGFVLTTSYGRLFHLSVRDLQGRPHVSSVVLHTEITTASGFFGSLRNVFASAAQKDIAAVHAAPVRSRSARTCVVAYADGTLHTWDLSRHGSRTLESEINVSDALHTAIIAIHPSREEHRHTLRLLDFAFSSRPHADRKHSSHYRIMLLCNYTAGTDSHHYLVEVILQGQELDVQVVHPIARWSKPMHSKSQDYRVRLLLPEPEHTAFVVGEDRIILVSIKGVEESPDTQLQIESHTLSEPFQDILMLNAKRNYRIVASATRLSDRGSQKAACHILVDNFGFARIAADPAVESESNQERRAYLCRSQIEQGVFFGSQSENLMDFSGCFQSSDWTNTEIEEATIAINDSIVQNKSKRATPLGISMDQQIEERGKWLHHLLLYVGRSKLSAQTRWHLLWSAEKINAARAVWKSYSIALSVQKPREKLLLPELLDIMSQEHKHENRPDRGETDIVRHYLLHDVESLQKLIPYTNYALQELENEGKMKQSRQEARLTQQALDLQNDILSSAFAFRSENCSTFGFRQEQFDDGLYLGSYEDLPPFWTSSEDAPSCTKMMVERAYDIATKANQVTSPVEGQDVDIDVLTRMAVSIHAITGLCCRVYEERYRWLQAQPDEESKVHARELYDQYKVSRKSLIVSLLSIEIEQDGFALAEQYRDLDALAELFATSNKYYAAITDDPGSLEEEAADAAARRKMNVERNDRYFKTYGDEWAEASFGYDIEHGSTSTVLKQQPSYDAYVDRFLTGKPSLKKIRWMHAVGMAQYDLGSEILEDNGHEEESIWASRVNLSMAKLCGMAAFEQKQVDRASMLAVNKRIDGDLAIVDIQEQLYEATRPVLSNAIDQLAEVDLAMDSYGSFVRDKPYLEGLLRANFEKLIQRHRLDPEELLDTLTLIVPSEQGQSQDEERFMSQRFVLALRLLRLCDFTGARMKLHQANIWRRCLLQDNWTKMNRTENLTDEKVAKVAAKTTTFQTLVAALHEGLIDRATLVALEDIVGAGTTPDLIRDSDQYATAADELVEAAAADLLAEDVSLAEALKKGRLELWWPSLTRAALENVLGTKRSEKHMYDKQDKDFDGDVLMA